MKKIIYFLTSLLLCVAIGAGAFAIYKSLTPETPTTENGDASINDGEGNATDFEKPPIKDETNGSTGAGTELTPSEDETSYIAEGMEMLAGASVYMGTDERLDPAIRFTCLVDNTLLDAVNADKNKSFAMLFAPIDYFDAVNAESTTYIDWVNAFEEAEKTVVMAVYDDYGKYDDDTSYMRFTLSNVLYSNINRRFVAVGVLIDKSGAKPVYKYSAMPAGETYRTNARSVAYVAGAALNAKAMGLDDFSESQMAKLKSYLDMAVDEANGLSAHTNNGDMPVLTITNGTSVKLPSNGTHIINGVIEPEGVDVPVKFETSNDAVAKVSETGIITTYLFGTAVIKIYVAGQVYTVSVDCSSNVQYA